MSDAVVVDKADGEDWDLDNVMTAAEASRSGLCKSFRELQTEYRAMYAELYALVWLM